MFRRVPKRFSLRLFLVFVALCALSMALFSEWRQWQSARDDFDHKVARWQFGQVAFMDVADAADELYRVESTTLWIPRRTAVRWQIERLNALADQGRAKSLLALWGSPDGPTKLRRDCDRLEVKATRLSAELADER